MIRRPLEDGFVIVSRAKRTIADLEGSEDICREHLAEAIGYRKLDRKL